MNLKISPSLHASQISVGPSRESIRVIENVDAKRHHHLTISGPLEPLGTRELVNVKYRIHFAGDSSGSSLWQPCSPLGHSFSSIFWFFFSLFARLCSGPGKTDQARKRESNREKKRENEKEGGGRNEETEVMETNVEIERRT